MPGKTLTRTEAAAMVLASGGGLKAAIAAFSFPSIMTHSGRGSWISLAPRNFPWNNTDPLGNSAVTQCLSWITRNFHQAEFQVIREKRDGTMNPAIPHPLTDLIYNPNAGYGAAQLWAGTVISWFIDGNAYWIKARNARGVGVPTGLWYVPHWMIEPVFPIDGSEFISGYEYRVNGKTVTLKPADVIHFRNGLDINNTRKGCSPLRSVLREIFTDDEAGYFAASLLKNMAIPGVVVTPGEVTGMSATQAESIKEIWKRKFGGDKRGEPLILDFQATIETVGFSPNDLNFEVLRRIPEERISGALGVPAIVAGLGVGLDSSTYNNLENLKKSAFEECLIPLWNAIEDTLSTSLLPELTVRNDEWCHFETSKIRALQENEDARTKRIRENYHAGLVSHNESRSLLGLPENPAGDYYVIPNNITPKTVERTLEDAAMKPASPMLPAVAATPDAENEKPEDEPKRLRLKGQVDYEGVACSREPTSLEKQIGLSAIDQAFRDSQETLTGEFSRIRAALIEQAADYLADADPADWDAMTLAVTEGDAAKLRAAVTAVFTRGRTMIDAELARQGGGKARSDEAMPAPKPDIVDRLVNLAMSFIVNTVRSVAVEIAARLNLAAPAVAPTADTSARIRQELRATSEARATVAAAEVSNATLAAGRAYQIDLREADISRVIYSSVLDLNTCGPCEEADGQEGAENEITPAPNPECEGKARCRCMHIAVLASEAP